MTMRPSSMRTLVAGRRRRRRQLDLSLPVGAGLVGGRPPHGVEPDPDAGERSAAAVELPAEVVALQARSERDADSGQDEGGRR